MKEMLLRAGLDFFPGYLPPSPVVVREENRADSIWTGPFLFPLPFTLPLHLSHSPEWGQWLSLSRNFLFYVRLF